jgi:DNA-binding winged helix-turn-helix (wHTH) protein
MRAFRLGERQVDLAAGTVAHQGEVLPLTVIETKLLRHLARRPGEVVTREELLVEVWGYRPGVRSRTIDTTTTRLRSKLEDDPREPRHLIAVYGQGLRLDGAELEGPSGFVGRKGDLARIGAAFREGSRLVTLVGPAGVGKSRTAAEVVLRMGLEALEVPCGAVRSPADLDIAVRTALGPAFAAPGPLGPSLARAGPAVLVLDECELCAELVARRAPQWLADAPSLRILATSRVRLGPPQEHVVALGPLEPDDAVALFLACLQRLESPPPDEASVRRVVGLLEGLPLELELAAARCPVVGLEKLEGLLRDPLGVLGGLGRRSMACVLERSFQVLPPDVRRGLTELSVFEATFDLDDLAAVLDVGQAHGRALVEELAARSLLRVEDGRYALYTVVRERARQDLAQDDPCRDRLVRWLARLGDPELLVYRSRVVASLRRALPDLRIATARALATDLSLAERCGLAAMVYSEWEGIPEEGLALGERVLAQAQTPRLRLHLGLALARLQHWLRDSAGALARVQAVVGLAEVPFDRVAAQCALATYRRDLGDHEGMLRDLELARPHVPLAGPPAVHWLQLVGYYATDPAESERLLQESARLSRQYGDQNREATTLLLLASRMAQRGSAEIEALHARARELCGSDEVSLRTRAHVLAFIGAVARFRGSPEAEPTLEEALELARRAGFADITDGIRLELAHLWVQQGRLEDARLEVEPLTWETVRPSFTAAHALIVWGELWLRQDAPDRAAVALREALAHAREGTWLVLQAEALDLLAVATADVTCLQAAAELNGSLGGQVRREALSSLLAAQRGEGAQAREAWERAEDGVGRLGLGPDSGVAYWLARAERAMGLAEATVRAGRSR